MTTTNGNMKNFRVTDKDGNVYVMTPVDTVARQAIDEAKNLYFDDDYFTSEVSQDETTVSVGLNGVPLGIDTDSPLKFAQDTENGIVFGSDAPFSAALAPEYDPTATYAVNDYCMHLGNYYRCTTAISVAEAWNSAHWSKTSLYDTIATMSTTVTLDSTTYLRTYGGNGVYAVRADTDSQGNSLTLGIDGTLVQVGDTDGNLLADSGENLVADPMSTAVVSTIGGLELKAARADRDASGNDIEGTYATKTELQTALGDIETALDAIINGTSAGA